VRLSLSTLFRRRWPSTCDALSDGSIDARALRGLFARSLADSAPVEGRPVWVIDGTNWPRPAARASSDRTWEYRPLSGWPQTGIVPAWAYQWLVAVPEAAGSWVLPLDVRRRGPTARSATQVALDQLAAVRRAQTADAPRPVVTFDSGYDLATLAHSRLDADLLVRLAKHRVVYRPPQQQQPGRGRPRLHGEPFRLADEHTHGQPQRAERLSHTLYGEVRIDAWTNLHVAQAPDAPFSVVRVQVERLPHKRLPPHPLWLAWIGGPLSSTPSASANKHSAGPPSALATRRQPTVGPAWSPAPAGNCGSPVRSSATSACPGSILVPTTCSRQARCSAPSCEYWSGWAHPPAHLGPAENRQDVSLEIGPDSHATMKWHAALPRAPLDLTKFVQSSTAKPLEIGQSSSPGASGASGLGAKVSSSAMC